MGCMSQLFTAGTNNFVVEMWMLQLLPIQEVAIIFSVFVLNLEEYKLSSSRFLFRWHNKNKAEFDIIWFKRWKNLVCSITSICLYLNVENCDLFG